jgi:hypothetical protein
MKTRIAIGCGLLLTLGTAVAGTWIYEQGRTDSHAADEVAVGPTLAQEVTPEMIAMWKASSTSAYYIAPRVPL